MSTEELTKLRKQRTVVKGLFTKANRLTEGNLTIIEVNTKLAAINDYWDRYKQIQDDIDSLVDDGNLQDEIDYRCTIEDGYLELIVKLNNMLPLQSSPSANTSQTLTDNKSITTLNTPPSSTFCNVSFTPYHPDETFTNFVRRLEVFLHLKNQSMDTQLKVYTLLNALTPQLHQKLYDVCAPENPLTKEYDELIRLLTDFIDPKPSVWALQHSFITRTQQEYETVNEFSVGLKKMTVNCEFNCSCGRTVADMFLRLQFIRGLHDSDIRTRLLQERMTRSYNEVVDLASAMELAKSESTLVTRPTFQPVHRLQQRVDIPNKDLPGLTKNRRQASPTKTSAFDKLKGKCYRCGSTVHRANQCKFLNATCRRCNKVGHIASVCLQKSHQEYDKQHQIESEEYNNEQNAFEINKISESKNDKFIVNIKIEGQEVSMELDTGAALSTISYDDFKEMNLSKKIFKTNVELRTYTGELIKPKGVVFVKCSYKSKEFVGKLFIIDQTVDPIFGRDWLREVKLDWGEIKTISTKQPTKLDELLQEFNDVFQNGIGSIPDDFGQFKIIEGARPIFIKPRQVPYSLKEKVEQELSRLENNGIITKVEQSDWATPIVPVVKPNGTVRICADYKVTLNRAIKDEKYPIPRIEDIFAQMNGGKMFCTLDISNAYLHMNMDDQSALMQTLSTHKGLYKVNRLMFGVKVAPAIWQRFMDKTLQGIMGVQCFFDDIIIQGSSSEELLERLRIVLYRLRNTNLRLNRDKCKFFQPNIQYLGHIIDENGLHKTQEKVNAITNTKRPQNITELRTFLGLANYYNKFIQNLATILHPLHKLLQRGKTFDWTPECEESFIKVKKEIISDNVLVHFNPDLPLVLATDASPTGLGAVLSHRYSDGSERPISFASRTLTKCECKYSQIDKEATGIYWGLKKFFPYCYGRKFTLITDHKPLVSIFNPHKTLPAISATRIFNYAHFLSGFDYDIEYRNTTKHSNADYLSRFPYEKSCANLIDDCSIFQVKQLDTLLVSSNDISMETTKDALLNQVREALIKGQSVERFGFHDNELAIQDGCIFKGWRVLIPESLQNKVLKELHTGHLGIAKMKALARSHCTWKSIDHDIEELVKSCRQCRLKQNEPVKEAGHPWNSPNAPWERIHIDFAGPLEGQWYFIVVDAFTKWVEVIPTRNTSTDWCIRELRKMFANFGLPLVLISDNGTQFTSNAFKHFLESNGVAHKTSAPYHPSSNGQAERYVQTVKKSLRAMEEEDGKCDLKLYRLLMQLRQAPNSTGSSAYHLMYGRAVRTHLTLLHPIVHKDSSPLNGIFRSFKIGDRVQARDYTSSKYKWSFGTVIARENKLHYTLQMDNGVVWRRHIDQILKCQIPSGS